MRAGGPGEGPDPPKVPDVKTLLGHGLRDCFPTEPSCLVSQGRGPTVTWDERQES